MKKTFCDICRKELPGIVYDGHAFLYLNDICAECYAKIEEFVKKLKEGD